MTLIQIKSKQEFAQVISDIQNHRFFFNGLIFDCKKRKERLSDAEVASFLALLRSKWQSISWTGLHLIGHDLSAELDLTFLKNLQSLDLSHNQLREMPKVYHNSLLTSVKLDGNLITKTPYLPAYPFLREFSISHNLLTENFVDLHLARRLKKLSANGNNFVTVPISDFSNTEPEYHLSSSVYTDAAKTLALAAHKHLGNKLCGYLRIQGVPMQLSSEGLNSHFKKVADRFAEIIASVTWCTIANPLMPADEFVRQNFNPMITLLIEPRISSLPLEAAENILAYATPPIDPVSHELAKFARVFDLSAGVGYGVFNMSRIVWQNFVESEECKQIKREAHAKATACRLSILKQLTVKPQVKNRLMLNSYIQHYGLSQEQFKRVHVPPALERESYKRVRPYSN